MVSLFAILLIAACVYTSDRYIQMREVEIHTKAGHSMVIVPSGFTSAWVVKDRGLMEFLEGTDAKEYLGEGMPGGPEDAK
jgi:hypothetical protein